jgi:hypothetical protein
MSPPESVSALLRANYVPVAKSLVGALVDLLVTARPVVGGDLDKLLIVMVVAQRTTQHPALDPGGLDDALSSRIEAYPSLYTNVRSIAESIGLPRETVRRKVAQLVDAGWIAREGDDLSYTPEASRALTPVREALFELAGRMHAVVESVTPPAR